MSCYPLNVYTKFQIDISKHVEKKSEKLGRMDRGTDGRIKREKKDIHVPLHLDQQKISNEAKKLSALREFVNNSCTQNSATILLSAYMICKRIFFGNCGRILHQLFKSDVYFTVYHSPKVSLKPVKFGQNYFSEIILSNLHG